MATELPTAVQGTLRPQRCETCKWWSDFHDDGDGSCYRYPPVYVSIGKAGSDSESWYHPTTTYDDFCGEWQAK